MKSHIYERKYCGGSVIGATVCSTCAKKLPYIRKIIAIGKLIKERAKNDAVCANNKVKAVIDSPVKHGEWIPDDYGYYHCSECGYEQAERESVTPYCLNCGAIMEDDERYDET